MNSISKNLKIIRTERGWTQQQMADVLFVTRQTVSNWENGKAMPSVDDLPQIAQRLGISTEELVYGKLPENEDVKKTLKISLYSLAVCLILRYICIKLQYFDSRYFTMTSWYIYYAMVMPALYFTVTVVICNLVKAAGLLRPIRGVTFHRKIAVAIAVFYGLCVLTALPNAIYDILRIVTIADLAEIDLSAYKRFIAGLPQWFVSLQSKYLFMNIGHPNSLSPYIWHVLGAVYEMTKPYQTGVVVIATPKSNHKGITLYDAKEKPVEYRRQCKANFNLLKKDVIISAVIFAAGLALWIFTPSNNDVNIFAARPVAMFALGLLTAQLAKVICVVLPHKEFRSKNTVRLIILVVIAFVAFMAVPHIVREIALALNIKVNGTYDLTGLVLTPPKWYSSLYHKTADFNTALSVRWYAVAGFVYDFVRSFDIGE